MSLRYLGGYVSPSYNPLAANVGPGVNVAQTQGVYTSQAALESLSANQWCTDPNFKQTTLLLQADGTANASQNNTFLDSSPNLYALTRTGTMTQGSFSPFSAQPGAWGNYFDGTGDYLLLAGQTNFAFGVNNFTIEFWVNLTINGVFYDSRPTSTDGVYITIAANDFPSASGNSVSFVVSGAKQITGTAIIKDGAWHHIALCRSATTTKLFVDGVQTGSSYTDSNSYLNGANRPVIASQGYTLSSAIPTGYMSNLRVVNGTAIYTNNFTPPTAPLTAITNTQLLTCQSNRFIDNSTNNFALTINGNPSIQPFSPFAPQYAYSPAITGGGSYKIRTDYLETPATAANKTLSGNFTIEAWVYFTNEGAGDAGIIDTRQTGGVAQNWIWGLGGFASGGRLINFYTASTNRFGAIRVPNNTWTHIATVRSGTTLTHYINGVAEATTYTLSGTVDGSASTNPIMVLNNKDYGIGAAWGTEGYISNFRLVNGLAVYTANFTPPTAPFTETSAAATALLVSATNTGIVDGTLKNQITTIADAKVNTSVKKFGSGSIAFDGTGDWLLLPDSPALQMGLGDFTVEGWVYLTATGTARGLVSKGTATTGWSVNITSTNFLQASYTSTNITGTIPLVANTWYHFAMVRLSSSVGNIKIYLNGVLAASSATAITTDFIQTNPLYVGANRVAAEPMLGYMDDVRITKMARYKDSFTPPTIAFARQ